MYRSGFWAEHLWIFVPVALIGAVFLTFGVTCVLLVILGELDPLLLAVIAAPALMVGVALVYCLWYPLSTRVAFNGSSIKYRYPRYVLFAFKEVRIPIESIGSVALGRTALSYLDQETLHSPLASLIPGNLGVDVGYVLEGRGVRASLPSIRNPQYFAEMKEVIDRAQLQQTDLPFVYKSARWPGYRPATILEKMRTYWPLIVELGFLIASLSLMALRLLRL